MERHEVNRFSPVSRLDALTVCNCVPEIVSDSNERLDYDLM